MMPVRQIQNNALQQENPLWLSWHDTHTMATLSPQTVMDYFCRKSNPFYEFTCNNETIRMQRLGPEHLSNMIGLEYVLLHVSEPILYVIRKQHRHSPSDVTPLADYYIIAGMVFKAPDLASVISSRILSTVSNLHSGFEEVSNYSRYNPSKGYTWDFAANKAVSDKNKTNSKKSSTASDDNNSTIFQAQRTDMLLAELLHKFPPPVSPLMQQQLQQAAQESNHQEAGLTSATNGAEAQSSNTQTSGDEGKIDPADMKPPPEKKQKL